MELHLNMDQRKLLDLLKLSPLKDTEELARCRVRTSPVNKVIVKETRNATPTSA